MIKTSSYFDYFGPGRVGISVGTPRGIRAGYRLYRALAPRRDMLSLDEATYRDIYFGEILARLDPRKVYDDLYKLSGGEFVPVMLCFERHYQLIAGETFCHRTMAGEWLADALGIDVVEHEPRKREEPNLFDRDPPKF